MGRKHWQQDSLPAQNTVAVSGTSTAVIPRAEGRVALVLCASATQTVTWSTAPTAVLGQGVTMAAGQQPLILDAEHVGSLVNSAWSAITAGAADNLTYIEVLNTCPCD